MTQIRCIYFKNAKPARFLQDTRFWNFRKPSFTTIGRKKKEKNPQLVYFEHTHTKVNLYSFSYNSFQEPRNIHNIGDNCATLLLQKKKTLQTIKNTKYTEHNPNGEKKM